MIKLFFKLQNSNEIFSPIICRSVVKIEIFDHKKRLPIIDDIGQSLTNELKTKITA
jgi:hypothetical protein